MSFLGSVGGAIGGAVGSVVNPILGGLTGGNANLTDVLTGGAVSNAGAVEQTNAMEMNLANTGYQRAVSDLRAAGLNPMLAYSNGPAPTPALQAPRPGDASAGITDSIGVLSSLQSQAKSRELQTAQVSTQAAQKENYEADTQGMVYDNAVKASTQGTRMDRARHETNTAYAISQRAAEEAKQAKMDTEIKSKGFDSEKNVAPYTPYLHAVGQAAGVINNAKSALSIPEAMADDSRPYVGKARGSEGPSDPSGPVYRTRVQRSMDAAQKAARRYR